MLNIMGNISEVFHFEVRVEAVSWPMRRSVVGMLRKVVEVWVRRSTVVFPLLSMISSL